MGTLAALRAAEEVAKEEQVRWGRIEFDVVDGQVHAIEVRTRHHRKDAGEDETETQILRESE